VNDDYDASRLPKHGQAAVERLRAEVARLERVVEHLRGRLEAGADESDTFAEPYDDSPQPLGKSAMVRFNGMSAIEDTFDVRMLDGDLVVRANDSSKETAFIPQSSSTVRIRMVSRENS
jgi:hypothetical protein